MLYLGIKELIVKETLVYFNIISLIRLLLRNTSFNMLLNWAVVFL